MPLSFGGEHRDTGSRRVIVATPQHSRDFDYSDDMK